MPYLRYLNGQPCFQELAVCLFRREFSDFPQKIIQQRNEFFRLDQE